MKKLILGGIILTLSFGMVGCNKKRSEMINYQGDAVSFEQAHIQKMPKLRNSQKRGFADLNCDGTEDMLEINDESSFFSLDEDFQIKYFEGYVENGAIEYHHPKKIKIPVNLSMFKEALKVDTADINGDECADVVFTSVVREWRKPATLRLKVAVNLGDLEFVEVKKDVRMNTNDGKGFQYWFNELVKEISMSEDETLSDYLKMDWADWDGNGTDDLLLFVKDGHSMDIGVFLTEQTEGFNPRFSHLENEWADNFLYGVSVTGVDTADITGNGCADVIVEGNLQRTYLTSAFLLNTCEGIEIHRAKRNDFGIETDIFTTAKKRDLVDENNDGKDDIIYITEVDDQPIKIIFHSKTEI